MAFDQFGGNTVAYGVSFVSGILEKLRIEPSLMSMRITSCRKLLMRL